MKITSFILSLVAAVAILYFAVVRPRLRAAAKPDVNVRSSAPAVNVVLAQHASPDSELILPANVQAFQETPIYARTNGYLRKWNVDLGDSVSAGQLLAEIEAPEIQEELNQARAALEQADANLDIAKVSDERYQSMGKQGAVPQQDVDDRHAIYAARRADVHAAQANVQRLTDLQSFQTIMAPFAGKVSARNVEVGALINANGTGKDLFRIVQIDPLRIYINVPQAYMRAIHPGVIADLLVQEFPGRVFEGKVVRLAAAADPVSRRVLTEVQISNSKEELMPGMFGQVRLRLKLDAPALLIPSNAVMSGSNGATVAVVDAKNTIHLQKVTTGRDFGTQIEILTGTDDGARVVANPSDSLAEGMLVEPSTLAKS
ncbi:MAG TPA: efflux RND transporter periplasmic adaptor subunit [Opitutaceae bacterium]|nr:efflux RND transporter periplasmic adaptor subunit [Opitutaceae bacterium]